MNSILAPATPRPRQPHEPADVGARARRRHRAAAGKRSRGRGVDARLDYASAERFGNTHPLMPAVALVAPWLARIARMPPKIACTAAFAPRATTFGGSHAHAVFAAEARCSHRAAAARRTLEAGARRIRDSAPRPTAIVPIDDDIDQCHRHRACTANGYRGAPQHRTTRDRAAYRSPARRPPLHPRNATFV
ncbi:hypothetical protein [Burkholderia pseudomallei]|uniref:hypothetical protein n=1 Tax=Burkholderia pseudomallei TaxID=28450 RepID=UPI001580A250|nr:hypothetical protein [Burkholderia pseudomallei]